MKTQKMQVKLLLMLVLSIFLTACSSVKSVSKNMENETGKASSPINVVEEGDVPQEAVKAPAFILGAGDTIDVLVYRNSDLSLTVNVDSSGKIMFPLVGDLQVKGLNIFQLRDRIREGLSKYIIDPQVSVTVTSIHSQKVIILGEVQNPGVFPLGSAVSILEMISQAGGMTPSGKQETVLLIRGGIEKPELITLDLKKALQEGDLSHNVLLQRGDIVYVPRTTISNVDRFFTHLQTIISPLLGLESGYFIGQQIEQGGNSSVSVP